MQTLAERVPTRELPGFAGVRLWCADLDQPPAVVGRLGAFLAPAERLRADALRDPAARRRFMLGRSILRILLARLTRSSPERLQFTYGPHGKPALLALAGQAVPYFNLSQSRDVALIAVAGGGPVGIDVEWTRGSSPVDGVVQRFFSAAERRSLDAAPAAHRRDRCFRIWVRKEAYLKGLGEGISARIRETDFGWEHPPDPSPPGSPLPDQGAWLVQDLSGLPPGFVGSVALMPVAP